MLNAYQLAAYKRKRATNPYLPAQYALADVRGYHPPLEYDWLASLSAYSEKAQGTVDGFDITVAVEYDHDSRLGDDDVTGWFVATNVDYVCIPNTLSYHSYRQNGQDYKWYHPSNYDLQYAESEVRALGVSRGQVAELVRARLERAMIEDADRQYYGVVVIAYRHGIELGSASCWSIDGGSDPDGYLQECAQDMVSEAIGEARKTLEILCQEP